MERIEKLKSFLKDNEQDSFLRHALALEYIKLGDDSQAQQLFEHILAAEPGYIGSYYHLGKLYERKNETEAAIRTYKKGMEECKKVKDMHSYNELQAAHEDITE